jgi:AcrR family transcriptional regulator
LRTRARKRNPARPGPRERLIEAGHELTYNQGLGVGVDAILAKADVARRSLYEHFGGKDGLLIEVSESRRQMTNVAIEKRSLRVATSRGPACSACSRQSRASRHRASFEAAATPQRP